MIIDPEDVERVSTRKWRQHKGYWITSHYQDFQNRPVFLHNFLLGMPIDRNLKVDHINRDPADNRKENLRFVTHRTNMHNLSLDKRNKAGVTGVFPCTARTTKRGKVYMYQYWQASYYLNGKKIGLGYHKTLEAAIAARREYEETAEA